MPVVKLSNKNLVLEGVRLVYRNFEGREGQYNRAGDRNFSVVLDDELAQLMTVEGWNVKSKPGREEGEPEFHTLSVTVNFKGRTPPRFIIITSKGRTTLDEDMVEMLDWADIRSCDVTIRPYNWAVSGGHGIKAYMQTIYVFIEEDYLDLKYEHIPEIGQNARPEIEAPAERLAITAGEDSNVLDVEGEWIEEDE